jgi:alpha-amylase
MKTRRSTRRPAAAPHTGPRVCFYFQVHQPYRLRDLRITDIGQMELNYFDDASNRAIFRKVAEKCYLPANQVFLDILRAHPDWRIAYSLSGVFMEQCEAYGPDVLASFKELAKTGQVEFLAETSQHSLSGLASPREFCEQVTKQVQMIQKHFGQTPTVFRNTELIYSNELAHMVRLMGFRGMLAEGVDRLLNGRPATQPYVPPRFRLPHAMQRTITTHRPLAKPARDLQVLLKHYRLSDDVAFRFSDRNWIGFPLTADQFAQWLSENSGHSVNLFMDYETFGEHQWAASGIFDVLRALPNAFARHGLRTATPSQVIDSWQGHSEVLDAHEHVSWADSERDLSAWLGNDIQRAALHSLYELESAVRERGDAASLQAWRRLQTSDHLYYMCTKYWADGDVHKYFSPYDSPYEAYRRFSHALCDLRAHLARPTTNALEVHIRKAVVTPRKKPAARSRSTRSPH